MTPAEAAWDARWRAVTPTAVYHPTWGLDGAWRENADAWGYNLSQDELDVDVDGQTLKGRVFSDAGLIVWDPATGPRILGWP